MKRVLFLVTGLLGVAVLTGCGDGDEPNPLATRTGFCNAWAERACNDDVVDACLATSTSACHDAQAQHCLSLVSSEAYREGGARACLDSVRTALQDGRLNSEEAGVVLRGEGACSFLCVDVGDDGCVEPAIAGGGDRCSDADTICDERYYCDGNNCLTKRSEGEACTAEIPCRQDLNCVAGTCEAKAANGEACQSDDDCVSGICAESAGLCAREIILSPAEETCSLFR